MIAEYGDIVAVSPNGKKYLLRKYDNQEVKLTVCKLAEKSFKMVIQYSLLALIEDFYFQLRDEKKEEKKFKQKLQSNIFANAWLMKKTAENEFEFRINDSMDISIFVRRNIEKE